MYRRTFMTALATGSIGAWPFAGAQRPPQMKRVGVIFQGDALAGPDPQVAEAFRAYGWNEGQTIEFQRRGGARPEDLAAIARDFAAQRLDVVVAFGTPAARAMQQATRAIPIFFSVAADPVASGLVTSLARPGGNLTGFCEGLYDGKMLELVKEIRPDAALVVYPQALLAHDVITTARTLGIRLRAIAVAGPEDLDAFFIELKRARADAVIIPPHPWIRSHMWQRIANELILLRLPAIGHDRDFVRAGGLMSFSPKPSPRGVAIIDRLLRGANPADIPVELPTEFDLAINLKTADAIGVAIPISVQMRADKVFHP